MQKLEEIAIKTVFDEYLNNKPPTAITKELLLQYLVNNKEIVDDYLSAETVYHVYLRHKDSYELDIKSLHELCLLTSFASTETATKWILENGKNIIDAEMENQDNIMVLTIIGRKRDDIFDEDFPTNRSSMFMIANREYPTYAFHKEAYDMLLDEHALLFRRNWTRNVVPTWIYWVKSPDEIIDGCSESYMNNLVQIFMDKYRDAERAKALKDFAKLKNPPI